MVATHKMCGLQNSGNLNHSVRARFARWAPLVVAALLTLTFLTFPEPPPDNDVDSSLGAVLSFASQQHLQFGPEVVFTYGPLGHLMFFYYSPHAASLRLTVDVALCLLVAIGLCRVAWRLRPVWRWLLLFSFFWIAPNTPTRGDFVIYTGLTCWGLLCFLESGRGLWRCVLAFTLLTAFGALAKISFLFIGLVSVVLVTCDLGARRRWRTAAGLLFGLLAAFIMGWLAAGQQLSHLGAYFVNGLKVVQGYNGALGWEGPDSVRRRALQVGGLMLAVILLRTLGAFERGQVRRNLRRGLLLTWVLLLSFSAWKYGCVRTGRETVMFGFFALLIWILEAVPCERPNVRGWALAVGVVAAAISLITLQQFYYLSWPDSLAEPFHAFARNAMRVVNPAEYQRAMEQVVAANRNAAQLPKCRAVIGAATVDVFGQCQEYALFNHLNYHPRPVFQSYVACTRPLMELNQKFYESTNAPAYVLFRLSVLDRKFPPMEDGLVLRTLLQDYRPILTEGQFILLKRETDKAFTSSLLREGTARLGEAIDLRGFGDADLWLEITAKPSVLGQLRQLLYRPPTVRLAAWADPGGKLMARNHAPAPMLAAGFLASPMLTDNNDVLDLFTSRTIKRPGAYSIEVPTEEKRCWEQSIQYRIHKIDSPLGRRVPAGLAAALYPSSARDSATNTVAAAKHDFTLFRTTRWHPDRPLPGGGEENLTFAIFLAMPFIALVSLRIFFRRIKCDSGAVGWPRLLAGNGLVLLFLMSTAMLGAEIYYRFFYDTTDSLAFTKTSERWVQRHWRQNLVGSRDDVEYSPPLEPGRRRITFVGDSFTAGHGIKNVEDRFPNLLRHAHPDWDIQVFAAVGLDTGGELALMKKAFAKGFEPDQVVLVYCLNDIGDLLPADSDVNGKMLGHLNDSGWLVRNSYAANLWYFHYQAAQIPALKDYCSFLKDTYSGAYWEQQKERLKAFRDLIESHGGKLSVVTFPFLHALGTNYEYQPVHDKLSECWRELGVPELDLLSIYKSLPPKQVVVNPFDAHPNEYANKLAAEAIDQWLKKLPSATQGRDGTNSSAW